VTAAVDRLGRNVVDCLNTGYRMTWLDLGWTSAVEADGQADGEARNGAWVAEPTGDVLTAGPRTCG
jgi:hypothetical protein